MSGMLDGCKEFDFKNFKRKINLEQYVVWSLHYESFSKEKLIDYLKMYKRYNNLEIKVLEALDKEKIVKLIQELYYPS